MGDVLAAEIVVNGPLIYPVGDEGIGACQMGKKEMGMKVIFLHLLAFLLTWASEPRLTLI